MKAILYSIKKTEREAISKANTYGHELIWQTSALNSDTVKYAEGCQAVIVFTSDDVSLSIINKLAELKIKYIFTRSAGIDHIDFDAAGRYNIQVSNVKRYSPFAVAEHTVALSLALSRHLVEANTNCKVYNFDLDPLVGFNLHGKTVGIVGIGSVGRAAGSIYAGFGCNVLGYDTDPGIVEHGIKRVGLDELLEQSDIISLHVPLNADNAYMIRTETLGKMKQGVMLINTARGGLVNTRDVITALATGKIGYYGADVYEFEQGLFFEDHETDHVRDPLLTELMSQPNVLVTPHQGFITVEALEYIAVQTMTCLDKWDKAAAH